MPTACGLAAAQDFGEDLAPVLSLCEVPSLAVIALVLCLLSVAVLTDRSFDQRHGRVEEGDLGLVHREWSVEVINGCAKGVFVMVGRGCDGDVFDPRGLGCDKEKREADGYELTNKLLFESPTMTTTRHEQVEQDHIERWDIAELANLLGVTFLRPDEFDGFRLQSINSFLPYPSPLHKLKVSLRVNVQRESQNSLVVGGRVDNVVALQRLLGGQVVSVGVVDDEDAHGCSFCSL